MPVRLFYPHVVACARHTQRVVRCPLAACLALRATHQPHRASIHLASRRKYRQRRLHRVEAREVGQCQVRRLHVLQHRARCCLPAGDVISLRRCARLMRNWGASCPARRVHLGLGPTCSSLSWSCLLGTTTVSLPTSWHVVGEVRYTSPDRRHAPNRWPAQQLTPPSALPRGAASARTLLLTQLKATRSACAQCCRCPRARCRRIHAAATQTLKPSGTGER